MYIIRNESIIILKVVLVGLFLKSYYNSIIQERQV